VKILERKNKSSALHILIFKIPFPYQLFSQILYESNLPFFCQEFGGSQSGKNPALIFHFARLLAHPNS